MTTIASCGHTIEEDDDGARLMIKTYTREGNKALSYGHYCNLCVHDMYASDLVLKTVEEEDRWLFGDEQ